MVALALKHQSPADWREAINLKKSAAVLASHTAAAMEVANTCSPRTLVFQNVPVGNINLLSSDKPLFCDIGCVRPGQAVVLYPDLP